MNRLFIIRGPDQVQGLAAFIRLNWKVAADKDKPLAVQIGEFKSKRSIEQNKRLHALLTEIAEQAWVNGRKFAPETWKEHFKETLIGVEEIAMPDGTVRREGISTTKLDVQEFSTFMERITAHATQELGVQFSN